MLFATVIQYLVHTFFQAASHLKFINELPPSCVLLPPKSNEKLN